jgi:hypothetical protein
VTITIDFEAVPTSSAELDGRMIREWTPPAERIRATMAQLIRLDTFLNPGLTRHEFRRLFAMCRRCRKIMTRRLALIHECIPVDARGQIIDLTEEDD